MGRPAGPQRVIVVDRDPKMHALVSRVFRAPEFEVRACPTARAVLDLCDRTPPDCVVSDLVLPDMDAAGLLRALRALPGLGEVPFVVATASRSELHLQAVLAAGADGYIIKPFPVGELLGKVRALLRRANGGDQGAETVVIRPPAGVEAAPAQVAGAAPAKPAESMAVAGAAAQSAADRESGRYSRIEVHGRSLVVLTEAKPRPRFIVTTVITEKGVALRKIETELPHALARAEDRDLMQQQIELQHQDTLRRLDQLIVEQRKRRILWSRDSLH